MEHSESPSKKKIKHKKKKDTTTEPLSDEPVITKVEVVRSNPEKMPPFVGYFPSGFDPATYPGSTDIKVYRNKVMTKRTELVVSPVGANVEFVGTSYAGEAAAGQRGIYALGVFDKEAKTLKVVRIAANKIFRLEPRVKGLEYKEPPPTETLEQMSGDQLKSKWRETASTFGTKKHFETQAKYDEIRKDEEPEAKQNLVEKMKSVEVKEVALANTEAHVTRNIPPYNASATTPQEAYVLDKIILPREWHYLEDIYHVLQTGEAGDFSRYPAFIRNRIDKLKNIKDDYEKQKISCIFSFINHLIKFKDQHSMDGLSSSKDHKIPGILQERFSTLFAVSSETRRLPQEKINLLLSYILVLTLFSDEFHTDYTDISKDLRMTFISVRNLYQHLGCRMVIKNKGFYATLPIPLKFPRLKNDKRKR